MAWDKMGSTRVIKRAAKLRPWTARSPWQRTFGARPWLVASLAATSALLGLVVFFYLRKRRQVAAHYNMGESGSLPSSDSTRGFSETESTGSVDARPQAA